MRTQLCRTETGLSSEQRILKLLQASPEQQAAVDRILSGELSLDALALRAAEAAKGPLLLRVKDAASLLGVHRTTLWRLVKAGRLETVELLGSLRVRRADIELLAQGHQAAGQTFRSGTAQGHQAVGNKANGRDATGKEAK